MLLTFAIPIALITLFALVFGGIGGNKESDRYDLIVCDLDNTTASHFAITKLDSLKSMHIIPEQLDKAQNKVKTGKVAAILVFHKGFSDSLQNGLDLPVELQYDEARGAETGMLQQSLIPTFMMLPYSGNGNVKNTMHNRFSKMLSNNNDKTKKSVNTQFDSLYSMIEKGMAINDGKDKAKNNAGKETGKKKDSGKAAASFGFGSGIKMTKLVASQNNNSPGLVHAVAGTAIMMLLFAVVGMGASLLDEKEEGTLKKLLYSPLKPDNILFGKMICANIISILQLVIMFIYAKLVFGLDILHHLPALILMIIATAYACSSFGVLLASFAKSRKQVQGLSTLIILVMSCLGGSMVPLFIMPAFMQKIAVFTVNYWGIQGFYDIFWRLLPLANPTFLSRILVIVLIGTALNLIALKMFRKNILKIA